MGSGCSPGGQPTLGKPIGLRGAAPALSGLVGKPKEAPTQGDKKIKEKRKKGKWEGREGLHLPILVGLGLEEESSSPLRPNPLARPLPSHL